MKKAIVVFIICVLAIGTSCKEEVVQINKNVFFPVKMGEMWGLVDTSCNFTLEPVYNCFGEFYQSIALVSKGDRIAYIDENGKLLKPFDFISGTHFSEGLAFVLGTDSAISCIDTAMNIVFALPAVERAEIFEDGLAAVKVGDKFGYIDRSGKNVIPCTFDVVTPFSEGYAAVANFVSIKDSLILKWNYIDKKGKVVIENKFDDALPFHMGKAAVRNENS